MVALPLPAVIRVYLDQGFPTRGLLDKLVRPFRLLSSFGPFFSGKKFFRKIKIFEANLSKRRTILCGGQDFGRHDGGRKIRFQKKSSKKM